MGEDLMLCYLLIFFKFGREMFFGIFFYIYVGIYNVFILNVYIIVRVNVEKF